jgi:hypothetical protein
MEKDIEGGSWLMRDGTWQGNSWSGTPLGLFWQKGECHIDWGYDVSL